MLFDFVLIGMLAVCSLVYAFLHLKKRHDLLRHGEVVQAHVVGRGENQQGSYQVLAFEVNGTQHQLPYTMPRKRQLPEGPLTLHYDPYKPENLLIEQDKTDLYGSLFCLVLGVVLAVVAVFIIM